MVGAVLLVSALVRKKEERAVTMEGATERRSKHVASEHGASLPHCFQVWDIGVQDIIAEVFINRSVESVGPGLSHDVEVGMHESLGGDLVDTSKPNWERTKLTREYVERGLRRKLASGALSQTDLDAMTAALDMPKSTPHGETAVTYRRRLMHHIRPSVDYAMFFSGLESREGEVITDASGKITGRRYDILARPLVQYWFQDLHASLLEYLQAVVSMLQKLSVIEILHR